MPQSSDLPPPPRRPQTVPKVLTRTTVARMLRCSLNCVRNMEKRGKLHPIIDRDGIRRFDRTEVENVARERLRSGFRAGMIYVDGELAAEVFRYFRDGLGFAEIVIRTHAP